MKRLEQLYEGKAKRVYKTEDETLYLVEYKDDATAFNGLKKGTIQGKGAINNRVTNHLMQLLEKNGIPTHFVEELSPLSGYDNYANCVSAIVDDALICMQLNIVN